MYSQFYFLKFCFDVKNFPSLSFDPSQNSLSTWTEKYEMIQKKNSKEKNVLSYYDIRKAILYSEWPFQKSIDDNQIYLKTLFLYLIFAVVN